MGAGCALMLAAFLSVPWIDGLAGLCAFYAVLGIGYVAAALVPCSTLIASPACRAGGSANVGRDGLCWVES